MAKRKLTAKLKEQIKSNPFRIRKADLSGDALKYLNRVRGARKAVKTKEQKARYKAPKKKRDNSPTQVSDLIDLAAKAKGMSPKQFRKKYKDEISKFEESGKLYYNREVDLLMMDIKFLPKGRGVYIKSIDSKEKRINRNDAIYRLTRFKHKILSTGLTYERISVEHYYDGKGGLHFPLPSYNELRDLEGEELLDYVQDNYPIFFYRK